MVNNLPREVSCYNSAWGIKYAHEKGFTDKQLFAGIEDRKDILENPREWADLKSAIKLLENFEKAGGNMFQAGIDITESQFSSFQLAFVKIASVNTLLRNVSRHFEKTITHLIALTVETPGKGIIDVIDTPKDKAVFSSQLCDFHRGSTFALLGLKHLRYSSFSEITCAARSNAKECRYRYTYTPDPPILSRLKDFFLFRFASRKPSSPTWRTPTTVSRSSTTRPNG